MMHVICGAPCSGKTTYVKQHAKPGELVIDADKIAEAIGSGVSHQATGVCLSAALEARRALIEYARASTTEAWVIHTKPSASQLAEYRKDGADVVLLDPGIEVCKRRAAGRPAGTVEQIERWYRGAVKTNAQQFAELFGQSSEG